MMLIATMMPMPVVVPEISYDNGCGIDDGDDCDNGEDETGRCDCYCVGGSGGIK